MESTFAARLSLVLKALSLSRARLAADIGVDKSRVGRWCTGTVQPSAHSLARLTQYIHSRHAGFTLHDWDASLEKLADRFGVEVQATSALPGIPSPGGTVTADGGADYEGFWRVTRPGVEMSGYFVHDTIMVRRRSDGVLGFQLGFTDIRFTGWVVTRQHQIFVSAMNNVTGTFVFGIFNGVARLRAEVVDGLIMTCLRDATSTPMASKCLLTRVGDLSGDSMEDERNFAEHLRASPFSAAVDVPEDIRRHLTRDAGADAAANDDPILLMHLAQSMARGPLFSPA